MNEIPEEITIYYLEYDDIYEVVSSTDDEATRVAKAEAYQTKCVMAGTKLFAKVKRFLDLQDPNLQKRLFVTPENNFGEFSGPFYEFHTHTLDGNTTGTMMDIESKFMSPETAKDQNFQKSMFGHTLMIFMIKYRVLVQDSELMPGDTYYTHNIDLFSYRNFSYMSQIYLASDIVDKLLFDLYTYKIKGKDPKLCFKDFDLKENDNPHTTPGGSPDPFVYREADLTPIVKQTRHVAHLYRETFLAMSDVMMNVQGNAVKADIKYYDDEDQEIADDEAGELHFTPEFELLTRKNLINGKNKQIGPVLTPAENDIVRAYIQTFKELYKEKKAEVELKSKETVIEDVKKRKINNVAFDPINIGRNVVWVKVDPSSFIKCHNFHMYLMISFIKNILHLTNRQTLNLYNHDRAQPSYELEIDDDTIEDRRRVNKRLLNNIRKTTNFNFNNASFGDFKYLFFVVVNKKYNFKYFFESLLFNRYKSFLKIKKFKLVPIPVSV